jgi:hypothetical protein
VTRPQVAKRIKRLAQLEQALLGTHAGGVVGAPLL